MIEIKSPTRVDLAGGTIDLWPLFAFLGGCKTINAAIDIYTSVVLEPRQDSSISVKSIDLNWEKGYLNFDDFILDQEPRCLLLRTALKYLKPTQGFSITLNSESPLGGGLGGSSSLLISILKAFLKWKNQKIDHHQLVQWAHNIEAQILHTPTGTQDYYPAILGGVHSIQYEMSGIRYEPIELDWKHLCQSFLLVDTGRSHHSGLNNWSVLKKAIERDPEVTKNLHEIKNISDEMYTVLKNNEWDQLNSLFAREFKARVALSPAFTSPEIERLEKFSMQQGALGVKICGAGGGGCVLVWCPPNQKQKIAEELSKVGFKVLKAQPIRGISCES